MDTERLRKIARFRLLAAQQTGQKMDLVRFSDDQEYAKQIITAVLAQSDHEELTVLSLELLDQPAPAKAKAAAPPPKPADEINNKYIGRLR